MPALIIIKDGSGAWPDLAKTERKVFHLGNGAPPIQIAMLKAGTDSGRPSVMMRIDLPDGSVVLAETTLRLFLDAAEVFKALDFS